MTLLALPSTPFVAGKIDLRRVARCTRIFDFTFSRVYTHHHASGAGDGYGY